MKKLIKSILLVAMILSVIIVMPGENVFAASAVNIAVGNAEATVGSEVEVTITLSDNTEKILMVELWVTYDPAALEIVSGQSSGGSGKVCILSDSGSNTYTLKFKCLTAGFADVGLVSGQTKVGGETTDQFETYLSSGQVTIKGTAKQSKNNNLSALTVTPGTLTPAFSKDVTTYNMTLDKHVSRLTVSATPEDSKSTVSVWGAAMDPGDNTTKITVTAENGDQKVYTIYTKVPAPEVVKEEVKEIIIEANGTLYNVVSNFEEEILPEGYEVSDYKYKDSNIVVGKGISNGKVIFCVADAAMENAPKQFVLYDEQTGAFSPLQIITTQGISYTVIDNIDVLNSVVIPEGYVESEYAINNVTYKVWVDGNSPAAQCFIIYCTNINGESSWYQYDTVEGSMQRAFLNGFPEAEQPEVAETEAETETAAVDPNELEELQHEYDNYVKKTKVALILMGVLLGAIVIVVILFAINSFKDTNADFPRDDDDDDDDDSYKKIAAIKDREKAEAEANSDDDNITFLD